MAKNSQNVVGIDFGTSTTAVAYSVRSQDGSRDINVIPLTAESNLLEKDIRWDGSKFVLGERRAAESLKAKLTEWDRKRRLGEPASDTFQFDLDGVTVNGLDALTAFLREVVALASKNHGELFTAKDTAFYLCCPASWGPEARNILYQAAVAAGIGLRSLRNLIDEPVAAGWSVLHDSASSYENVLVFDAGGGTVDVAMLTTETIEDGSHQITVLNADADPRSGNDLDGAFARRVFGQHPTDGQLKEAEDAKKELSFKESISSPFKAVRADLEEAYVELLKHQVRLLGQSFQRSVQTEEKLAHQATNGHPEFMNGAWARKFRFDDISSAVESMKDAPQFVSQILLTGGMAQIPVLKRTLEEIFPEVPVRLLDEPQLAVCKGLTRMEDSLWFNGARLPIAVKAKWSVIGMDRSQVKDLHPELDAWMTSQENLEVIGAHVDAWGEVGSRLQSDALMGATYEFPSPPREKFPNECNWDFGIEIQVVDTDGKLIPVKIKEIKRSISVTHQVRRPATVKLLVHRRLVVSGANGERYVAGVRWRVGGAASGGSSTPDPFFEAWAESQVHQQDEMPWPYLGSVSMDVRDTVRKYK